MKTCCKCGTNKSLELFSKKRQSKDGRQSECKECRAAYLRSHYKKNKRYYMDKAAIGRAKLIEWYRIQKAHPCMDCGHTYPYYMMDFDHRDPQAKKHNVSELVAQGRKKKLEQELAKCDLVCANCHRERTHRASIGPAS